MSGVSPVRRLLVVYAGLWALLDLAAALPGSNPSFSSTSGLIASVVIQCLLIWRLSLGSAVAWGSGLFMALGTVAFVILAAASGVAVTLIVIVCLLQAGVLLTSPLRRLVWRPTPPASA